MMTTNTVTYLVEVAYMAADKAHRAKFNVLDPFRCIACTTLLHRQLGAPMTELEIQLLRARLRAAAISISRAN